MNSNCHTGLVSLSCSHTKQSRSDMQFTYSFTTTAEDVFERVTDAGFIEARCLAMGSLQAQCQSDDAPLPLIIIHRTEEAELPAIMKKVVGNQQKIQTEEQWSETEESYDSLSLTKVVGTPIEIHATQCLYNLESGSEITVDLTVSAKIPLIGKKIEPMVASKVRTEMLKEFDYVNSTLASTLA